MPGRFTVLLRLREDELIREWVDAIYADPRTDLPALLSYRQLIDSLPEVLDEWAHVLDEAADERELVEAARWLRRHAQVRFQQGCLLDEVARELMILRRVLNDFLWREGLSVTGGDLWELRAAISLARLLHHQGRSGEARTLLLPIYSWFKTAVRTPDLEEAQELLGRLQLATNA